MTMKRVLFTIILAIMAVLSIAGLQAMNEVAALRQTVQLDVMALEMALVDLQAAADADDKPTVRSHLATASALLRERLEEQ